MSKATAILSFRSQALRRVGAVACLALFLSLLLFSSSERLHKWLHPDADSEDHHCAVTLMVTGQVNMPAVAPLVTFFAAAFFFLLPLFQAVHRSSFDYRFSCSRAPPLA